jgi:murein DD-endopeptidase MepM/ murein hydrolase activator NlpD
VPPGHSQRRVAHAHPRAPDARASRIAVAFRDAERRERRLGRSSRNPRRFAVPATGVLAIAAALVLASQAFTPSPLAATSTSGPSSVGGAAIAAVAGGAWSASPAPTLGLTATTPLVGPLGRAAMPHVLTVPTGYRWPLEHARITQGFGPSPTGLFVVNGQRFHDGIDIANFCGAPILAAHDGTVIAASRHVTTLLGWTGDVAAYNAYLTAKNLWGTQARVIVTDDGNGFRSVYIHLHRIDVTVGQVVKAGQQIGLEGNSGHATGCHLHFSIYRADEADQWVTNPTDVTRYHLPTTEIARVNPLELLPSLATAWITWGWGTQPKD